MSCVQMAAGNALAKQLSERAQLSEAKSIERQMHYDNCL